MSLVGLLAGLRGDPTLGEAAAEVAAGLPAAGERVFSATSAAAPAIIGSLATANRPPAHDGTGSEAADPVILAVTSSGRRAEELQTVLSGLLGPEAVMIFPAWETLPHERLSPAPDLVGRRIATLHALRSPGAMDAVVRRVVVAPVRALLQPFVAGLGEIAPIEVGVGDELDRDDLAARLAEAGYERVDLVTRRGEFAVRGGLVDVFAPTAGHPLRLEFFGDEIESVREFSVADQRSIDPDPAHPDPSAGGLRLVATPVRELPLTDDVRARAANLAEEISDGMAPGEAPSGELFNTLEMLAGGVAVPGMESLAPVLASGMQTLVGALPPGSTVIRLEPELLDGRAEELVTTSQEFLAAGWQVAAEGGSAPVDLGQAAYVGLPELAELAAERGIRWWGLTPFASPGVEALPADPVTLSDHTPEAVAARVSADAASGAAVLMVTAGHGPAERVAEFLSEQEVAARLVDDLPGMPEPGSVTITTGPLDAGFRWGDPRMVVLTEAELFGTSTRARGPRRMPTRRRRAIDPLELQPGDFVVHEQHGVGRYVEMAERTSGSATREYVVLEYAASKRGQQPDRLYVPTDQLELITRYVGGDTPTVHRLGGSDWQNTKSRARRAVRQIAAELVRLYAARQASPGHAFGPDTPWQRELEDAFDYVETPDQLAAVDEVKADMEKPIPMDRIICGDVGYGKTEIAVRAAFKAVMEGTQVIVLVPTTLLVQQHMQTFSERFAPFGVNVQPLSRFQSKSEVNAVFAGLADGTVDVVIGTHRLLAPGTAVKNLGLVIVDEEQRFGVEHKEHLKALRTNVDVLTMSATPIPRTLEMAVTGIREMSTIATPPEDRLPVLTFVGPYDDAQVGAAIRRELMRDGQVFYLHNRVAGIDRVAKHLSDLVPEARIGVAHGQMNEGALEQVILDFWDGKFDVLVCTTIVESGLDISNANTLIVDRADRLGLSQLHQIRGRVGRGRERGYAYFMYPTDMPMSEKAHERLRTIAAHSDLGSGMAVAMKDLEIRGAGNLLGGEQSGHIADVGFDLYVRLVGEALTAFTGNEGDAEPVEVKVELPVDAHIPHDYIASERLRLAAYRSIAAAADDAQLADAEAELRDRFGPVPPPVARLLEVARLRSVARQAGISELLIAGSKLRMTPLELADSRAARLARLYPGSIVKPATRQVLVPVPVAEPGRMGSKPLSGSALIAWIAELIESIVLK